MQTKTNVDSIDQCEGKARQNFVNNSSIRRPVFQYAPIVPSTMFFQLVFISVLVFTPIVSSDCVDYNENCNFWAETGECAKNPGYMLPNCRQACDECSVETTISPIFECTPENNTLNGTSYCMSVDRCASLTNTSGFQAETLCALGVCCTTYESTEFDVDVRTGSLLSTTSTLPAINNTRLKLLWESCKSEWLNQKIVGGEAVAIPNTYPFMVVLGRYRRPRRGQVFKSLRVSCGGTLLTQEHILTAAHCTVGRRPLQIARFAEHDLNVNESREIDLAIIEVMRHPGYQPPAESNDIAILRISPAFEKFTLQITPGCLPFESYEFDSESVFRAMGFGRTEIAGRTATVLNHVDLPFVNYSACSNVYADQLVSYPTGLPESTLCAGIEEKDACQVSAKIYTIFESV